MGGNLTQLASHWWQQYIAIHLLRDKFAAIYDLSFMPSALKLNFSRGGRKGNPGKRLQWESRQSCLLPSPSILGQKKFSIDRSQRRIQSPPAPSLLQQSATWVVQIIQPYCKSSQFCTASQSQLSSSDRELPNFG